MRSNNRSVLVRIGAFLGFVVLFLLIRVLIHAASYAFGLIGVLVVLAAAIGVRVYLRSRRQSGTININSVGYQPGPYDPVQAPGYPNQQGYNAFAAPPMNPGYPQNQPGYPAAPGYPQNQEYPQNQNYPGQAGAFQQPGYGPQYPGYPAQPGTPGQQPYSPQS
ncbi:hypothetical protein [Nocardia alni]|uniref:hypothetical protein n=1 Tax=Nocardia alni TaxID=2815723 RepID=UPI001C24CC0B|nr:hypothetical protein [Nocardia alni]